MRNDYDKLMDVLHPVSMSKWFLNQLGNIFLFGLSVALNVLLGFLFGALLGWALGDWISPGLALFGIHASGGDACRLMSNLGLLTGFIATFFKHAPVLTRQK